MTTALQARLSAAIETPETGLDEPQRRKSSSFAAQVLDLEVGETAPRISRIDPGATIAVIAESLPDLRNSMRNGVSSAVRRAMERTGGEYSVEVTDFTTPAGAWFVLALVTRVS
jgi:hypothetical protein